LGRKNKENNWKGARVSSNVAKQGGGVEDVSQRIEEKFHILGAGEEKGGDQKES